MGHICKIKFEKWIKHQFIEEQIGMAFISAECTYGKPKVRLHGAYLVSKNTPQMAIDVSTEVGEHIAQVFIGLMNKHIGEDKFDVDRVEAKTSIK